MAGSGSEQEIIKLAVEAGDDWRIRNRKWVNKQIVGPAVCALSHCSITNSTFEETAEMIVWAAPKDQAIIGLVGLEHVEFDHCSFRGVSFLAPQDEVEAIRQQFRG